MHDNRKIDHILKRANADPKTGGVCLLTKTSGRMNRARGSNLFRRLLVFTALHYKGAPDNDAKGIIDSIFGSGYGLNTEGVQKLLARLYSLGDAYHDDYLFDGCFLANVGAMTAEEFVRELNYQSSRDRGCDENDVFTEEELKAVATNTHKWLADLTVFKDALAYLEKEFGSNADARELAEER